MVWIRLPNLQYTYYHDDVLTKLSNCVGRTIKIDHATTMAHRGKYAPITIELNLEKPLASQFKVNGEWQNVEYEGLPYISYLCKKVGHSSNACPMYPNLKDPQPVSTSESALREKTNLAGETITGDAEATYGPWMVVQRRSLRQAKIGSPIKEGNMINQGQDPRGRAQNSRMATLNGSQQSKASNKFDIPRDNQEDITATNLTE
ncbi:hypothetical protein Syun_012486 [Stephania yunnanensis]|uniref:DUF4283 domain-containing protein n=1 Tax=Stephania yunnanensis TaxID=152371 RepID=A0AAP0JZQ3_9MAGN